MEEKCGVDSSTLSSSLIPFAPNCSRFLLCISRLSPCPKMSSGKSVRAVLLLRLLYICPPSLFGPCTIIRSARVRIGASSHAHVSAAKDFAREYCHLSHPKTAPQNKRRMPAVQFQLFTIWPKRAAAAIRCKAALSFPTLTTKNDIRLHTQLHVSLLKRFSPTFSFFPILFSQRNRKQRYDKLTNIKQ